MSHLDKNNNVIFEAAVSTMNYGSLERGQGQTEIFWPGQQGMYNYPLDQLARRMYEKNRLEFFCMREILFHGKEIGQPQRAASLDRYWGVKMIWPYKTERGHRYVFTFHGEVPPEAPGDTMQVNDLEMPDIILINGEKYWERGFGETLFINIEFIAKLDDVDIEICLLKDRHKCIRDAYRGWGEKLALVHANCHGYVHLHLGLNFACEHFGLCEKSPTSGEIFDLPLGMRTFKNLGPWQWIEDEKFIPNKYPPIIKVDYPTTQLVWINFHDIYLDENGIKTISDKPEVMRELVQLSLDNGINGFVQDEAILEALESLGYSNSSEITIWFSGSYIKRTRFAPDGTISGGLGLALKDSAELDKFRDKDGSICETKEFQQRCREIDAEKISILLNRFPKAFVIYRLNEFSGCQYAHVVKLSDDRQKSWPKSWYHFTHAANSINKEAISELLDAAKHKAGTRLSIAANVQTGHLAAHPLFCGADFIMEKDIGRNCVNLVVANSRGVNSAFDRPIGLQHDAWGGLNYNRDSAREIESIHRSFFFNGVNVCDAEFGNFALNKDGHGCFNKKGMAWIKVTRLAAIHPLRGRQRVKIGFLKGSDQIWGWYYPTLHTLGSRHYNDYDPREPKEYIDFELLDIVFPKFGKWHSLNPRRGLTGTPYGPCDFLPWNAPLEALKRYKVLPMLGANRVNKDDWNKYIKYVESGGTIVMGLYQLLSPSDDQVYFKNDVSDLLGIKLGKDILMDSWENVECMADFQTYISEHYNKILLRGAEIVEKLPNGDPLLTKFKLGKGTAYFFTTDRLQSVGNLARKLIRGLFEKHKAVILETANDFMEIAISEKDDLRIITLMDHGQDCLPTDIGVNTGTYSGRLIIDLDNLDLPEQEYEVFEVVTDHLVSSLQLKAVHSLTKNRQIVLEIRAMESYIELVIAPKNSAKNMFFGYDR